MLKITCIVRPHNNLTFTFQLMTVSLLNTAGYQNFNYQAKGVCEHLEALLYPIVLEISMLGIKIPDIR